MTTQGRYEFLETLGTGATSRVDKARDTLIGRTVAIKTFLHGFGPGDLQKQFQREAQIIGRLAHPSVVGLYDVGTDENGVPFFIMEYVEGKTLEKILDAGPLPLEKAVMWATDLAAALSRAHRAKIIHGDVKPANILVTKDGQIKLGDFGVARFATQVSASGNVMGTPAYLSPEQIQGNTQDTRSDLFSLGIILYQMTTGVRPFDGSSVSAVCAQIIAVTPPPPSQHNASLPPAFDRVVMRCLAKEPADRYATAESLAASLYPFGHGKDAATLTASADLSNGSSIKSTSKQFFEQAFSLAVSTFLSASRKAERLARDLEPKISAIFSAKSAWWNRPMQKRDTWIGASIAAALILIVPIAHALRNRSHDAKPVASSTNMTLSATSPAPATTSANPSTSVAANQAPIISDSSTIQVLRSAAASNYDDADSIGVSTSGDLDKDSESLRDNRKSGGTKPIVVTRAFEQHAVPTAAKLRAPKAPATAPKQQPLALKTTLPVAAAGVTTALEPLVKPAAPVIPQTTLHIAVVSGVTDQTLAIYSGEELLLTTPLQTQHLGDTLRFNCPIPAGEHALRVVLYRADKTVALKKENNSELHVDGANTMEVRVNRKSKMLLKHETSLEVVWPSSTASSSLKTNLDFKPAGALSLR
jgi:serine/threonine protein kinase